MPHAGYRQQLDEYGDGRGGYSWAERSHANVESSNHANTNKISASNADSVCVAAKPTT